MAAIAYPDGNRELCEPFLPVVSTFQATPSPIFFDQGKETGSGRNVNKISDLLGPSFCFPQKLQQEALDKWPCTEGLCSAGPGSFWGDWFKLLSLV